MGMQRAGQLFGVRTREEGALESNLMMQIWGVLFLVFCQFRSEESPVLCTVLVQGEEASQ